MRKYIFYLPGLVLLISIFICCNPTIEKEEGPTDIFMWMGTNHLLDKEPEMYHSMMAFASRHQIIPYESGANSVPELEKFLKQAKNAGIQRTWIEIGPGKDITIREFVENPEKRNATLERFQRLAKTYKSYYPDFARITIFDEAPLGAFGRDPENDSYIKIFEDFKKYAPKAFSILYGTLKSEFPEAEVGIFMHHPHNASPEMAGEYSYIEQFMKSADSLGTTPDFIYSDVYRGYFNRGYGQGATDAYITDVVGHTNKIAKKYGADAYQLGQMHTIKLGYTPSQRQIDTNVNAMLKGNPDGIGWYWPNYAGTNTSKNANGEKAIQTEVDVSFDPFIPNNWGSIGPAGSIYGTSRDRFSYGYLRMLEATGNINPEKSFDLWLYGYDFDKTEHSVWLRSSDEDNWKYIGHINPQQDANGYVENADDQYRYNHSDNWHAVAFRGLSRDKFLNSEEENQLQIKIESEKGSDGSRLSAVYIQPYHKTRHFPTEKKITRLIEQQPRWVSINSLADHVRPIDFPLSADTVFTGKITESKISSSDKSFDEWL